MQNYQNHVRYYPLHHFVLTPLTVIYFIWSWLNLFSAIGSRISVLPTIYHLLGATILLILPFVTRIYALKNQDRIIRMEMRQRFFELTGTSFYEKEKHLRLSQIVALRFAGDKELLPLIDKVIEGDLRSKVIKQMIEDWKEDRHRV
jgi:hypothetical protein